VVLAATEAAQVIPSNVGMVSNRVDELVSAASTFTADRELAADLGLQGRKYALERFGLGRFLYDWDKLLEDVAR